jgi:type IV pilus biogenesis protein CpaD/CtpE
MKRSISTVFVVVLLVAAIFAVAGCGGDTGQAKTDITQADTLYKSIATDSNQLAAKITAATAALSDPAKVQASINDLNAFLDGMDKKANEAKADYAKVQALKGAGKYVTYANMQTKLMDLITQATGMLKSFMGQVVTAASTGDTAKIQSLETQFETQFNNLTSQITTQENASAKFKADNNL